MKPNRNSKPIKATKIFTDREEPRKAFWDKYESFKEVMDSNDCDVCILTYYGIGGIGKTSLLKKLQSEMDEKIKKPQYIYFDFNTYKDSIDALTRMAKKLSDDYGYTFPLFELGASIYKKNLGENYDPIGSKLAQKNDTLGKLIKVLGIIPGADYAAKLFELGTEAVDTITKIYESHRAEVNELKIMSTTELYDYLPYLFAKDIENNLKKATEPLVVFLDTYEVLVNEISQIGDALIKDKWLRDENNGLVINTTKVLWVVAGREKLKWSDLNPDWESSLEQHLLGDLSPIDSDYFLETAGVHNTELRNQLYELTNGTPVYLDLCVDRYLRLLNCGETPDIAMFGHNTHDLIERFIRYMDDSHKDLIYMLTCLRNWDDEFVHELAGKILSNFSETTFEKVKSYSFVIETNDNEYNIHQTVREVLFKSCPSVIKKKTGEALFEKFLPVLKEKNFSKEYGDALLYVAQAGALSNESEDLLYNYYKENLQDYIDNVINAGYAQQASNVVSFLLKNINLNEENPTKLYISLLNNKSQSFCALGEYMQAQDVAEKALEITLKTFGEHDILTAEIMSSLAIVISKLGQYKNALDLHMKVLNIYIRELGNEHSKTLGTKNALVSTFSHLNKHFQALALGKYILTQCMKVLGENHIFTIETMSNISYVLLKLERHDEAILLLEQVIEKFRAICGDNHPDTLTAMNNLACELSHLGKHDEAISLLERVVEKRRSIFGDDHPNTILAQTNRNRAELIKKAPNDPNILLLDMPDSLLYNRKDDFLSQYKQVTLKVLREEVLKKREKFGENHIETFNAMKKLASNLTRKNLTEGLELVTQIVKVSSALFGENHPNTLRAKNQLATVLGHLGDYEESFKLYQELMEKNAQVLGEYHTETIDSMKNYTFFLYKTEKYDEYIKVSKQYLEKQCVVFGEFYPQNLSIMKNIAYVLYETKRYDECVAIYSRVLKNSRDIYGDNHLDTINVMDSLANAYVFLGKYDEALELLGQVLEKRKVILGEEHCDTLITMNNIACVRRDSGDYYKALELFEQVLEKRRAIFGKNHQATLRTIRGLNRTLCALGRDDEVIDIPEEQN